MMNIAGDCCDHHNMKSNLQYGPTTEASKKVCLQGYVPCNSCCSCYERNLSGQQVLTSGSQQYQPCGCPGQQVLTSGNQQYQPCGCTGQPVLTPGNQQYQPCGCTGHPVLTPGNQQCQPCGCTSYVPKECNENGYNITYDCQPFLSCTECIHSHKDQTVFKECSPKNISWTEPTTCVCDPYESQNPMCCCRVETAAKRKDRKGSKKNVRFADEVTYIDCDKAFENLQEDDVNDLCRCCKELAIKDKCGCVCKPVMVYELPEPKMEEASVTKKDFHWHKTPEVDLSGYCSACDYCARPPNVDVPLPLCTMDPNQPFMTQRGVVIGN